MRIPDGMTETEVLDIFRRVIKKLSFKFRFGVHSSEDIAQQGMVYAIEAMDRFDASRPLENFIYIHVRNRLFNFKRNNYFRLELPCCRCPIKSWIAPEGCKAFTDRMECELYKGWAERNTIRKNLTNVLEYGQIRDSGEKNMHYGDNAAVKLNSKEILALIDKELPISMRKNYLKRLSGEKISKKDSQELEETIISLIKKYGYEI